jgi:hypothetical protein
MALRLAESLCVRCGIVYCGDRDCFKLVEVYEERESGDGITNDAITKFGRGREVNLYPFSEPSQAVVPYIRIYMYTNQRTQSLRNRFEIDTQSP